MGRDQTFNKADRGSYAWIGYMEVKLMVTSTIDNRQGEYRAICIWNMEGRYVFAIIFYKKEEFPTFWILVQESPI